LILFASMVGLLVISELLWLWPTWELRQIVNNNPARSQEAK
jgi:hypothetical protein